MQLSGVVVALLLLVPPQLLAQHSSGSGSSSGGSSSGGSSNSSSSSGSSHGSSSGGSSGGSGSGSASSSAHSGGASASSSNHSTGGSASRSNSSAASATHGSSTQQATRRPLDSNARVQGHEVAEPSPNKQTEHRGFFAFLRHPLHKAPKPGGADLRHKNRKCPAGQSGGKNGACVANNTSDASNQCSGNAYGSLCTNTEADMDACASVRGQAAATAAELRSIRAQMQPACSVDPSGEDCSGIRQRHEAALERYRTMHSGAPAICRASLADPSSL